MNNRLIKTLLHNEVPNTPCFVDAYNCDIRKDGITGTITARVDDGNHLIIENEDRNYPPQLDENMNNAEITAPCILSAQRTEEGKRLRRLHGDKNASFEHREFSPRKDGISNTITTIQKDNLLIEPFNTDADGNAKTLLAGDYKYGGATLTREKGSSGTGVVEYNETIVQRPHGANKGGEFTDCPTITTSSFQDNNVLKKGYRIRKLTPKECFRLMDVPDEYIDRIQAAGISNAQMYKMAGNSIVVACMEHIFRKLFIEKDCEAQQLSLF